METGFGAFAGGMAVLTVVLLVKIYMLQKAAIEIERAFAERLATDTNTLISISSRDRSMRRLANAINGALLTLRAQRRRYLQGDMELKRAVTNISHDLRTPLTAICGYLDLLEQEEQTDAAKRHIAIMRDRAEMTTGLTEELFRYFTLAFGEKEAVREPVAVNGVLEESIAAFYTILKERGIAPVVRMPERKVVRMLERSALSRVCSNLLHNAAAYSDGDLEVVLSETGELVFSNTAAGLDAVQAGRLFDRFYTVEAASQSTGLGLAITKTLVEQMGGSIAAEYKANRLRICVTLPEEECGCGDK